MQQSRDDQLAQFEAGLTMGLDPDNRAPFVGNPGDDNSARRLTTLRSRWLHRRCTVCGHSFRLGDEVTLTPSGGVVHDMPRLRCAEGATTAPDDVAERQAFFQGLDAAWASSTCIERLEDGHYLLAPPQTGRARSTCRVCGHTFRPGDHVVICRAARALIRRNANASRRYTKTPLINCTALPNGKRRAVTIPV